MASRRSATRTRGTARSACAPCVAARRPDRAGAGARCAGALAGVGALAASSPSRSALVVGAPPRADRAARRVERFAQAWAARRLRARCTRARAAASAQRASAAALRRAPTATPPTRRPPRRVATGRPSAATATSTRPGRACDTRIFGTVARTSRCRRSTVDGDAGGRLARRPRLPRPAPRREAHARDAAAAARDDPRARRHARSPRAPDRASPTSARSPPRSPARSGPRPPERAADARARAACPTGAPVGLTGLERELRRRGCAGTPRRRAAAPAARVLARRPPPARRRRAHDDRSTRRPARGGRRRSAGRFGGIAAMRPAHRRGARARRHRVLRPRSRPARRSRSSRSPARSRPKRRRALERTIPVADRRRRSRASSSRTPTASRAAARSSTSFAESCNSVFAPLGAQARRAAAGRRPPSASASTSDPAIAGRGDEHDPRRPSEIGDDLAVGSIGDRPGQGAGHAAADGDRRRDDRPSAAAPAADARRRRGDAGRADARATTPRDRAHGRAADARRRARRHRRRGGDPRRRGRRQDRHRRAARRRRAATPEPADARGVPAASRPSDPTDTDAWFAAFAPARQRRAIAVGVLLVGPGAGGDTAAPAARDVAGRLKAATGALSRARRRGRPSRPCRARPGVVIGSSSGRFSRSRVLSLKSSSAPWIDALAGERVRARAGSPVGLQRAAGAVGEALLGASWTGR